ncbi:MAG: hypothetical protein IKV84_02855, partial [Acinetobacter sp.]|nr:hypothetical protein [Acinetobacter sp.]
LPGFSWGYAPSRLAEKSELYAERGQVFGDATEDQLVDPRGTYAYYQQLCKSKKPVLYQSIQKGDHRASLRQSDVLSADFLKKLAQGQTMSSCAAD